MTRFLWAGLLAFLVSPGAFGEVIVAEGEKFRPLDGSGWKVTHQNDSYGSHTYGGMWMTHGGCLAAPAASADSEAAHPIEVPAAGTYRVWSKYQAPPYFSYLHEITITQKGRKVFSHVYGKMGTPRLWSFSGVSNELWWPWGVDHDAAEAPPGGVRLEAGPAEVRLRTVKSAPPAGDRHVDFVLLTTTLEDTYQGFKPYAVGTPFANEALAATRLYLRFQNTSGAAAQLGVSRAGHFQPQYGGATTKVPEQPAAAGQWSAWHNIGPFCRLVHDEGLTLRLPGAEAFRVQVARDPQGKDLVGDVSLASGEAILVPIDVTWNKEARVRASRTLAEDLIAQSRKWPKANGGKKPAEILFYGAFNGSEKWVADLKDALGYNTGLPDGYAQVRPDRVATHFGSPAAIQGLSAKLQGDERKRLRVVSFGDEIGLGRISFNDPKNQEKFRAWLAGRGVTAKELGTPLADARLTAAGDARLVWYSNLFNEEERFAAFRGMTELAKKEFGPQVLTGANYSPHHLALCYGPIYQWVDVFKHRGMSMFWAEDYIFSVPEVPQILSWMFAQIRCGTKYHQQPIHFYVMPHAPGQLPSFLRRNTLLSVGLGARHIDNFWVAPEERFTENYVAWGYQDTFRVLHDVIHETAEAEKLQVGGKVRPARVALVTGKATDFNESQLKVPKGQDPFAGRCQNAPEAINQIICRKDQQMLYLALRHAQHAVDLITEDDIVDLDALEQYDVVYFAGEWVDHRIVPRLAAWVERGGVLYATAGLGHRNEFGEPEQAMLDLLGLRGATLTKNVYILRTLLELPLLEPIDTITLEGEKVPAVGMKQVLTPSSARVLGKWSDGSAAVTVRELGKGKAFAVGTLAGNSYMKSGVRPIPWARGGRKMVYNPVDFLPAAARLARLGVDAASPEQAVVCSIPFVEGALIDHPKGALLTLAAWTNEPARQVGVKVRLPFRPREVRSVRQQKGLPTTYEGGVLSFQVDVEDADYILLPR